MQQGTSEATVTVTIETTDGRVIFRTWRGRSARSIERTARARYATEYPGADLQFGTPLYTNSYGAH